VGFGMLETATATVGVSMPAGGSLTMIVSAHLPMGSGGQLHLHHHLEHLHHQPVEDDDEEDDAATPTPGTANL
jgi:hypothetical protein